MTAITYVFLNCDSGAKHPVLDSPGDETEAPCPTATEARRAARSIGWRRAADGRDLCPYCVARGAS